MSRKNNFNTYKPGTLHWRKGYQSMEKILPLTENGDKIIFPSRLFEINEQLPVHNSITLSGSKSTILHIPNNGQQEGFNQQGFYIPGNETVTMQQLIIEVDPEVYAIDVPESFSGTLILDQIETRYRKRVLYTDNRPVYPSIRIRGKGTLKIRRSILDYVMIDAPDMTIQIEQSTIGSFEHSSLIRAKEVNTTDTVINNCQIDATNGSITDLKTQGGIALQGQFQITRTQLFPLEAARPEHYPQALTYMIVLPGSKVSIKDILSKEATKPPYYRHFDIRQSEVSITGSEGLKNQLLANVLYKSIVHVKGGRWIKDPSPADLQLETHKLHTAHQTYD